MYLNRMIKLLFHSTVVACRPKVCSHLGKGSWNVTYSTNPFLRAGSIIDIFPDNSFHVRELGIFGKIKHDPPMIGIYLFNSRWPFTLNISEHQGIDRLLLKQGLFQYEIAKLR